MMLPMLRIVRNPSNGENESNAVEAKIIREQAPMTLHADQSLGTTRYLTAHGCTF